MANHGPITLAIPCYNAEAFIGTVLHSVEKQTLSPAEILVIDDGSSDGSREKIRKHPGVLNDLVLPAKPQAAACGLADEVAMARHCEWFEVPVIT